METATNDRILDFCPGVKARVREGAGESVLWVHGYTIDSSLWDELWAGLPQYCHIGIDMPGHGLSPPLQPGTSLVELGEALALAALDNGVRHVVGLSLGSMIALQVALSRPQGFASLCVGAPAVAGGPADEGVGRRYTEMAQLFFTAGPGQWMRELWMRPPPDLFRYAHNRPLLWEKLCAVIDRHSWGEFRGCGVARMATERQPFQSFSTLGCRTLVLVGEYEFPAFQETARQLQQHIPDCRLVNLSGVGHLCMLEEPDLSAELIGAHWAGRNDSLAYSQ